ncbi:DUF7544 domain-containing protein [Halobacterium yunchengense]|uniref:DUF7544 domain-containing protein n=1 Tax=Halobacterium yunchengense TaxID=3108497 RepID=UPI003009D699
MSWYAVDALEDALDEARALLLPFDAGVWVRLAVVALFAGLSPPQTPTVSVDAPPQAVLEYGREVTDPAFLAAALALVAAVAVVGLAFAAVGSVMEFVLVDALRSRDVRIREPFGARLGAGLRLFGFRILVGVAVLLAVLGVAVPAWLAAVTGTPLPLLALVVTVPLVVVAGLAAAVVLEFTTAFVVPLMAEHGGGVLATWRELAPTLRAEWRQFGVYALVKLVLLFGASLVFGIAAAVVAVPVGLFVVLGALNPLAFLAVAAAVVVGVAVLAAVSVPVVTFVRYHSLCTLDASGADFALRRTR